MRSAARLVLAALLLSAACVPALPQQPVERALVRDVARVVDVRQKVGWLVDDVEVEAVLPDALKSACHVDEAHRTSALAWLDGEIGRLGGPPVEAWRRAGKDLSKIDDLLLMSRTRLVLARADTWVRDGKCPFWIEPDPAFDGFHVLGRRWIFGAEAGGRFIAGAEKGIVGYGVGGGGRLLGGYGITERASLFLALEAGGGARFTSVPIGQTTPIPVIIASVAAPVVFRHAIGLSGFMEAETGPMAYLNQVEAKVEPGFRAGVGIGASYLRMKRGLLPRFAFALTVDHVPGWSGSTGTVTQVSAGLKAGFDLSR